MFRLQTLLLFLLALISTSLVPQFVPDAPTFHDEKPSRLKVKVLKIEGSLGGLPSALLTLEVSNPTEFWAEPTAFSIANKGRGKSAALHPAARVAPPYFGRFGRAIAPKDTLTYLVNAPFDKNDISKSGVEVTHASFFEGAAIGDAPIVIGKIDDAEPEQDFQGGMTRFSRIELRNTSDVIVDAILLAKFSEPHKGESLVQCRLHPGEARRWTVEGPSVRWPLEQDARGSQIKSVELVDWSALSPLGSPDSLEQLRNAYDARAKWPTPELSYSGRYELEISEFNYSSNKREVHKETGKFTSKGAFPQFTPDPKSTGRSEGWILLGRANQTLSRPPFEEWIDTGTPYIHAVGGSQTVIALLHPGEKSYADAYYWIEADQIIGEARSPHSRSMLSKWSRLKATKTGTLVEGEVERMIGDLEPEYPTLHEYTYAQVGGVWFPRTIRKEWHTNPEDRSTFTDLSISEIRVDAPAVAGEQSDAVPSGPLADQVREAWERGYRYPSKPVDLSGRFTVTNPGNDFSWHGHKKVEGSFTLLSFAGSTWDSWTMELDGDYTETIAAQLKSVVEDRLRMYSGRRDHAGRGSFDEVFAGARFEEVGRKLMVYDCNIKQVEIKKGRLDAFWHMGERRKLKWTKRKETEIVTQVNGERESLTYVRKDFDGWWIPVDVKMKDVFEDWGPERVLLEDLVLSPASNAGE